jgi:hypothetical protein
MHMATEMYRDVKDIKTFEVPSEFFNKTFIRHLMLGTGEASRRNERVHAVHENHPEYRFDGTLYKSVADINSYGTIKYLTNLKNRMTMKLKRFMICAVFATYLGLSRQGIWTIINGITSDRQNGQEIEFVVKKISRGRKYEATLIRAAIQEHRAVMGLVKSSR